MTSYTFQTSSPVKLAVEFAKGDLHVVASEVDTTLIDIDAADADRLEVEQSGDQIRIVEPKRRGLSYLVNEHRYDIRVTVPAGSQLRATTASADVRTQGELRGVWVHTASGDVLLDSVTERAQVQTASGDLRAGRVTGEVVMKTASGDVDLGHLRGEVRHSSASGDLRIKEFVEGKATVKTASGDVTLGIPNGTPVWTDLSTATGRLGSTVQSAGEPEPGGPYVELHASTATGNIDLTGL